MDTNDEKFFAQLAGADEEEGNNEQTENYQVELAAARTSAVASRPRTLAESKASEDDDMDDSYDGQAEGQLTVDVYQTPEDIVIQSAIAGVKPEDINISATPDAITIRGTRHHEKEVKDDSYLHQECYWGRFARSVIFPQEVDPESATVNFKNGILTVRLPKVNKKKSKKLKVKAE